jgi:hypothetical protein
MGNMFTSKRNMPGYNIMNIPESLVTAEDISECITKSYVFDSDNYYTEPIRVEIHKQIIEMQQISPPKKGTQIEAFGGILYKMSLSIQVGYNGLSIDNWVFIMDFCMEHVDMEYFVLCVIRIIERWLCTKYVYFTDSYSIGPEIYAFLVFLTQYCNTNRHMHIYWTYDTLHIWVEFFRVYGNQYSLRFCNDSELVCAFLEILKYSTPRENILLCNGYPMRQKSTIYIPNNLVYIPGFSHRELWYKYVHEHIFVKDIYIRNTASKYWPFLVGECGELKDYRYILKILEEEKTAESYPKSAMKR